MTEIIYYRNKTGVNTREPLRSIRRDDEQWLRRVITGYQELAKYDERELLAKWFNMPNPSLPKQPMKNNERNSARSFCEGIIDKLDQSPCRRDLSPRQCEGIEALSKMFSEMYEQGACPNIVFKDRLTEQPSIMPDSYSKLFRR